MWKIKGNFLEILIISKYGINFGKHFLRLLIEQNDF